MIFVIVNYWPLITSKVSFIIVKVLTVLDIVLYRTLSFLHLRFNMVLLLLDWQILRILLAKSCCSYIRRCYFVCENFDLSVLSYIYDLQTSFEISRVGTLVVRRLLKHVRLRLRKVIESTCGFWRLSNFTIN